MSSVLGPGRVRTEVIGPDGNPITKTNRLPNDSLTAEREVAAYTYDRIIEEVGLDKFRVLVPGWESEGLVLKDLLNPRLVFTRPETPTVVAEGTFAMGAPGLLHDVPWQTGSAFVQNAWTQNTAGSSERTLAATGRIAQKLPALNGFPGFAVLQLRLTGTLSTATLKASIYDGSSEPESLIAESDMFKASDVSTGASGEAVGFHFADQVLIQPGHARWLVLEYADATGVDGSNYVSWLYDSAGAYGEDAATQSGGTWAANAGHSQVFSLYDNSFILPDSFTFIVAAKDVREYPSFRYLFGPFPDRSGTESLAFHTASSAPFRVRGGVTGDWTGIRADGPMPEVGKNEVFAMTFDAAASTDKLVHLRNGRVIARADGVAGKKFEATRQPLQLGVNWIGPIGPWMVIEGVLTPGQIASVTNLLLTRRKLQYAV